CSPHLRVHSAPRSTNAPDSLAVAPQVLFVRSSPLSTEVRPRYREQRTLGGRQITIHFIWRSIGVTIKSLPSHMATECPRRVISCDYCDEDIVLESKVEHESVCPKKPVICN